MLFKYKGFDKSGAKLKGTISANNIEEASIKLKSQGIYYESLKEAKEFSLQGLNKREIPTELLASFSKELSSYLGSGMTILTAIKLMENQHLGEKKYLLFLNNLKTMIDEGKSLYQALQAQDIYTLPEFYMQSLNVAAQGGKMQEVLTNMAEFFMSQYKIKKQIKGAMVYPTIIFIVAIAMTSFLIAFVVPKITEIFEDTNQALPPITQFVLHLSDFLTTNYQYLIIGTILSIILYKISYHKSQIFHTFIDGIKLKTPILGMLIQNHELGRFSYILALMLDSGVAYAQAVNLAVSSFSNYKFKAMFQQASQKVVEGNKLSHALYKTKGVKLKSNFLQTLALGEESSNVASVMGNLSELYAEENEQGIDRLLKMVEPVMMLLIGGIVGVIVMAMLLPIFSMSLGAKL